MFFTFKLFLLNVWRHPGRLILTGLAMMAAAAVVAWIVAGYDAILAQTNADQEHPFGKADLLLLTDIYSAGEKPLLQITASRLAREIRQGGHGGVHFLRDKEQVITFLAGNTRSGDLVLTLGAGDVWQIGRDFLKDSFPRSVYSP